MSEGGVKTRGGDKGNEPPRHRDVDDQRDIQSRIGQPAGAWDRTKENSYDWLRRDRQERIIANSPQAGVARVIAQRKAAGAHIERVYGDEMREFAANGYTYQRKASGAPQPSAEEVAVSQPGDPAEKEADTVADHVADKLHGGGEHTKEEHKPEAKEAAPAIGAKLQSSAISLAPKNASSAKTGASPTSDPKRVTAITLADAVAQDHGIAKQKYADVMNEAAPRAVAKLPQFIGRVTERLKADPKDPLQAMRAEAALPEYLCLGNKVSDDALTKGGGVSRVIDLPSLFKFGYLSPAYLGTFLPKSAEEFVEQTRRKEFDPNKHLDNTKPLRGQAAESWWFPSNGASAVDLAKLRHELYVEDNPDYAKGAVRLDMPPSDLKAHSVDLFKPTAFDGLHQGRGNDPWWQASGDPNWGLTKNQTKEAVMPALKLGLFQHRRLMMPTAAAVRGAATAGKAGPRKT